MSTQEIATRLADFCAKGEWEKAQKELYANDAVSIEPYASEDFKKETKGLDAILEKGEKFSSMVDTHHKLEVSKPVVAGESFAMTLRMDVTMKGKGRMDMTELCVYQVRDGKIVLEQFFM